MSQLVRGYHKAAQGSQAFRVRLIELVAVTMHQLAALLFQLEIKMHHSGFKDIEQVTRHKDPPLHPDIPPIRARVSLFNHRTYLSDDLYPEGVADVVRY